MPNEVKIGAKLKKKDAPECILEVIELRTPEGDLPHARARIRISRFDLGVRLYSVSALQDNLPALLARTTFDAGNTHNLACVAPYHPLVEGSYRSSRLSERRRVF